ncbi:MULTISPECIES: YegS/Rv2252/BmrU family lipid kinase [Vagococcus]|uniref:Transcription regulator [contains diacylglycerol kinase catalytic domain] n=1 Tax=Vagococcus fluvialis bH819 TaxID=1255619 RepID=A0A1X6WK77_9ENTE|nr:MULTISPECIES: YegS/Rv2252/BmrU family lipid kinase [Vagococcus]SLM84659.1 Transcription regulator [contains diacylglycerol kinase catalytic domain] [Vagococcus fluvialis bH819]HCM89877.1 lipid kinase [Vagococcus sp.]
MKPYGILFNPNAGNGESERKAKNLQEKLKNNKIDSFFIAGDSPENTIQKLIDRMSEISAIIAIGGDGTLNIVGTAFIRSNRSVPLGIIPGGTINNFAKRWNIPIDTEKAIAVILDNYTNKVSIGKCNDQAIISSFTFGKLADISNDVRQSEKQKYGLIVYPYQALKKIGSKTSYLIRFKTEKEEQDLKTWVTLITTTSYVGGLPYTLDDPNAFHINILNNMTMSKAMAYLTYAFTGHLKGKKTITRLEAESLEIINLDSEIKIQSRIDGDPGPDLPLHLEWKKDLIDLMVPIKKE